MPSTSVAQRKSARAKIVAKYRQTNKVSAKVRKRELMAGKQKFNKG